MTTVANGNGSKRWQIVAAIGGVSAIVMTLVAALITLNVQLANVSYTATGTKAAADALSIRVSSLDERSSSMALDVAQLRTALLEIETQFCANDIVRNLMHANDMRIMSILWDKLGFGARLPTDNVYYPNVCNRNNSSNQRR